ncbi:hypothetical protein BDR05DRAFT_989629 [Suillus weaverae]|nr:hypothetical protein BDR05DRAFT_989629 [Suillus weaverae]
MTESTPQPSLHGSDSSVPNTRMHMGQFSWPQPAYIPGYASLPKYPYGMPPNGMHGAAPQYAPVAPSAGAGAGVAHQAFQPGQNGHYPPAVANVLDSTYVGPYPPLTAAAPPQQYPSAPQLYHQPFPSGSAPSFLPQVPTFSVAKKRVAEDLGERDAKRTKVGSCKIKNDPLFKPVLDQHGQPDGTFICSKDGMVLNPESYLKHLRTKKHLGFKLERYRCPGCPNTYTRRDACKRHWDDGCGKLAPEGARLSYAAACQLLMSSAPVAPVAAPTTAFTYYYPYPMLVASMSQNMQVAPPAASVAHPHRTLSVVDPALCLSQPRENDTVTEPVEDEDDAEFWQADEIRDVQEM